MGKDTCTVDDCGRPRTARGLCQTHYNWDRAGKPLGKIQERRRWDPTCKEDGCDKPTLSRGWCMAHYHQFVTKPLRASRAPCTLDHCGKPQYAKGVCAGHYKQQLHYVKRGPLREMTDPHARDEDEKKQCRRCRQWFPEAGFFANVNRPDLLNAYCRRCDRDTGLRRRFGIGIEEFEAILEGQGGGCAICGQRPTDERSLAVDHDHSCCPTKHKTCGKCIRGLLCFTCNAGLGQFFDDPDLLGAGAEYLRSHGKARA